MLPKQLSFQERFQMALDVGFAGIEMRTVPDQAEAHEIKEAVEQTGLGIHSVMNTEHWRSPLSSDDSEVVNASVAGMETSLPNAQLWSADAVLLVPGLQLETPAPIAFYAWECRPTRGSRAPRLREGLAWRYDT